jgi:DNA repair photolyase
MTPLLALDPVPRLLGDLEIDPEEARSILRPQKDERYGFGYSLNPYRGCAHGCRYCYVREYPHPLRGGEGALRPPESWGTWVSPKLNAPALLWAQRHRLHEQTVFLASSTDPYMPLEKEFRLTRKCLEVLRDCPTTRVLLHTRSPLVIQDLDLLREFGDRLTVGFSVPTDDDTVRQVTEPKAPPIPSRWAAMERLARAGVRVSLSAAPLMAIRDIDAFAQRAKDSGARSGWAGRLRLLKQDPFYRVLAENCWLFILDPDYSVRVNAALAAALPRPASRKKKALTGRAAVAPPLRLPEAHQLALFEG